MRHIDEKYKKWAYQRVFENSCMFGSVYIHHNLVITRLLGSKTLTVLDKQPCYIHTKMYRLCRKNDHECFMVIFYIIYTFLGSIIDPPCYTENCVSHVMRKPAFCICENKDADQLCGNRTADQRLCFRYIDSTIPLLSK